MFGLFNKKETVSLPLDFGMFPPYQGNIKKGPIIVDKPEYKRITYYIKGNIDEYREQLASYGYVRRTEVRYDKGSMKDYVILEKELLNYKLSYHVKKNRHLPIFLFS